MSGTATMTSESIYQKSVLENGVRIVSEYIPHVRSVSIGVWIQNGSRNEVVEKNGISHFVEHMVFKGTTNRTTEEIAQSLEAVGGHLNAFTSKELTCYYARVLDEHVPLALEVLADILINSLFKEEDIEKERQVILEEIKNRDDTPDDLIHDLFFRSLYEPHPLAWPILGSPENIRRFSAHELRCFVEDHYANNRTVVVAAGNVEHNTLVDFIQQHFCVGNFFVQDDTSVFSEISTRIDIHQRDSAQTHVCVGTRSFPYARPQRIPLFVLSTLLGRGMSSRLFQNIREKEGLAYSIFTIQDFFVDTGIFGVYAGTDSSHIQRVLALILQEFQSLVTTPVSEDELTRTKSQLKGNLMLSLESTSNRMMRLSEQEIYLDTYSSLDETIAHIDRVTAEDIQTVATDLFDPEKFIVTVLGPVKEDLLKNEDLFVN
ncbi:MAG: insulinase family protein [Gemmatimonadota bacterium]|nr:MAG: insulinase family protein [Gemmatimonadota bacterium]